MNRQTLGAHGERLLKIHWLHLGLYARVAKELSATPGYVSRVARGKRKNAQIMTYLLRELRTLR